MAWDVGIPQDDPCAIRHGPRLAALPQPAPVAGCQTCGRFVSARSTRAENSPYADTIPPSRSRPFSTWRDRKSVVTLEGFDGEASRGTREAQVYERTDPRGEHRTLMGPRRTPGSVGFREPLEVARLRLMTEGPLDTLTACPSCCADRRPGSRRRSGTVPCRAPGRSPRPSSLPRRNAAPSPGA